MCHKTTLLLYHYSPAHSKGGVLVRKPDIYSSLFAKFRGYLNSLNEFGDVFLHRKSGKRNILCKYTIYEHVSTMLYAVSIILVQKSWTVLKGTSSSACLPLPPTFTFNPTSYRQWSSRVQSECLFVAVHNSTSVTRKPDFYLVTSCFSKFDAHVKFPSFVPLPIKLETAAVSKQSAIIKHRLAKLSSFNFSHLLVLWDPSQYWWLLNPGQYRISDDITFYIFYFSFITSIISLFFLLASSASSSSLSFPCHYTFKSVLIFFSYSFSHFHLISTLFPSIMLLSRQLCTQDLKW